MLVSPFVVLQIAGGLRDNPFLAVFVAANENVGLFVSHQFRLWRLKRG
jgi:hypothetical protein